MEPGQHRPVALHGGDDCDAHGVESLGVGGEAVAVLGHVVAQDLELLAGGHLARPQGPLELAFGGGVALGLYAGGHFLQAVLALDLPHQLFLAGVVVAIADDLAVVADPVGHEVDVVMLSVGVPGEDVLVLAEAHAFQVPLPDLAPFLVAELFAGRGGQGDVQHGFAEGGPEVTDRPELGGELAGGFSGHIGVKKLAFLGGEVVGQGATEARAFDGFGDHGVSPRRPSRAWRRSLISARRSFTNGGVKMTGLPSLARRVS